MGYTAGAVERAMKVQEVIVRALSGQLTWIQAADILGRSPRSIRRLRHRYALHGYDGLWDRRRQTPSPRRAPVAEVERVLRLYRTRYAGFNVRHFLRIARREHHVTFCYSFVKTALQHAGLVPKHRPRGRHRRRRDPRACFGELLHLDGSRHQWLARVPDEWLTLLVVVDDATKHILSAQFTDGGESTAAVMTALRAVVTTFGVPLALYTDRAHWAAHTPVAGGRVDRTKLTQVGRALAQLGIEPILGYSPQARGRSERANRTLQGRLVNELRVAGASPPAPPPTATCATASSRTSTPSSPVPPPIPLPPSWPSGASTSSRFCVTKEDRVVARDNTVTLDGLILQLAKQPGRRTCAGLRVLVRRHLDGRHSLWLGARRLGLYDLRGHALPAAAA